MRVNILLKLFVIFSLLILLNKVSLASSLEEGIQLFNEGKELSTKGNYYGALEIWDKALEIFKENKDSKRIACLLSCIGILYSDLGDYPKSLQYLNRSLEMFKSEGDTQNSSVVAATIKEVYSKALSVQEGVKLLNEGMDFYNKYDYFHAADKLEKAGKIFTENKNIVGTTGAFTGLGSVYTHLGDYSKALMYYSYALEIDKRIGLIEGQKVCLAGIGDIYNYLADYFKSLEYYNQSLEISKKTCDIKGEAAYLMAIGTVYSYLGDYTKALEYQSKALILFKKVDDLHGEACTLNNIAVIYSSLGDYTQSLEYQNQSLEITRKIGNIVDESNSLANTGSIYTHLGEYSKALEYYNQALEICRKTGYSYGERAHLAAIGNVYFKQGELVKAYEIFNKLDEYIKIGKYFLTIKEYGKAREQFNKLSKILETHRNADQLVSVYIGLGLSEEGLKNYQEAERYYKKAVEFIEHQRETLGQTQRKNFFEGEAGNFSRLEPYEGLVRIYHYLKNDGDGILYAESTKARLLSEEIAKKYEGREFIIPEDLTRKERDLINSIASIYKQIDLACEKNDQEKVKELEGKLKPLREEQEKFISNLRQLYPEYASIMYPKPLKIEEIKLKPGEVLIEYEVTDRETMAYLIRVGKIVKNINIQITRNDLTTLIKVYRGSFEDIKDYSELGNFSPETGKKLYDLLLKDILSEVKGEKIIIVPDDILGILPFEALVTELPSGVQIKQGNYGPYPEGVKYVADTYLISYYQSASALSIIRNLNKGSGKKGIFAVTDPVFSNKDDRLTGIVQVNPLTDLEILRMDAIKNESDFNFSRLKLTGEIAKDLGGIFPGELVSLTGMEATEDAVKSRDLSGYKYLLFATHGILDNDVPYIKEPALVLCQTGKRQEDGFITMSEVMNIKFDADVAVLSACKTGLGRTASGEGIMGMGRAFQYAGAKSVLISLWSIESVSTNMMTEKFFEGLKQGKSNMEALKDARAYIRSQGYEHPFFWAPFILVGD